jgi:hypothetical protein
MLSIYHPNAKHFFLKAKHLEKKVKYFRKKVKHFRKKVKHFFSNEGIMKKEERFYGKKLKCYF